MHDKQSQINRHVQGMQKQARKQKLNKALRQAAPKQQHKKNRQKKIPTTSWDDWDDLDELELASFERIMPKGERERQQKIEDHAFTDKAAGPAKLDKVSSGGSIDPTTSKCVQGLVIEAGFGMCRVDINGNIILCDIRGAVKDNQTGYINPIAVGDRVTISRNGSDHGVVEAVLPRHSVLSRPFSPDQGVTTNLRQILVSNVDQILIVASWREPFIWPALIDRYLITSLRNEIEPIICINKIDLVEEQTEFDVLVDVYRSLGFKFILTSIVTHQGIQDLKDHLKNRTTVLAGLSGVGKSSLLTTIQPSLDLKIGMVSEHGLFTGQGRHTTTQSRLWKLEIGGVVVDTPGIRSFGLAGILPSELVSWYPEMLPHAQNCRFRNCTHVNGQDCSVIGAVENGKISPLRYKNYLQILEELST